LATFTPAPTPGPRLNAGPGIPRLTVPAAGDQRYVPDEVLLSFSANVDQQAVVGIAQGARLSLLGIHRLTLIDTTLYRFRITDGRSVPAVIASFGGDNRVSRAQPNFFYAGQDDAVARHGDPAQYALGKLNIAEAHLIAQGDHVLIALIDSSVDLSHPELQGVLASGFDAVKTPDRPERHGTAMASAIVAHGKLLGVAPAARLLAARAFEVTPAGTRSTTTRLLDSLQWASDSGARVINMSFAGPADPRLHEMIQSARRKGAVLVAAAGNAGPQAPWSYPAAYPEVIGVTATDSLDQAFSMANRGPYVAVAAPGVDIMVAAPNGAYDLTTGTSVATAHVSGLAALLLERNPDLTADALQAVLMRTAKDLGWPGRDDQFGAGLVNAQAALNALTPQVAEHAEGN
jgi:subtilisin family serine protease